MTPTQHFIASAHEGLNLFLTGMAGTGKSFTLREFISEAHSGGVEGGRVVLGKECRDIDVTAPTGIAALNIGGMTVHRWAGMLLGPKRGESFETYAAELERSRYPSVWNGMRRVRNASCLVIDEISMMPGVTLDFLNFWMRRLRGDSRPFGGCQLIVVGDFMQLPPVAANGSRTYDWCFATEAWTEAEFETVMLTEVKRQDEPEFVRALGDFRLGAIANGSVMPLRRRVVLFPDGDIPRIYSRNSQVDRWNDYRLSEIDAPETVYNATKSGDPRQLDYLTKNLLTPDKLVLKPGARVMFTRNHPKGLWVNGSIGTVDECQPERVFVRLGDVIIPVEQFTWKSDKDREDATFTQFPLRLAYAMTIHKSQGITLDSAYVDIKSASEPGQAYVAISRVRTLAGLNLKEWPGGVWVSNEARNFYQQKGSK
jgi:ATP-dependent DNA helicase PIF1